MRKRTLTAQQKLFAKEENQKLIYRFRSSVTLGVLACFLLNIFWCFYVLQIVPQKAEDASIDADSAVHKYNFTTTLKKNAMKMAKYQLFPSHESLINIFHLIAGQYFLLIHL